jgi:hypothetical protein
MHDMCDTREMCEARESRSSRACRASSRDPCMRDVWGMPRPADLRACEASDPVGHYTPFHSKFVHVAATSISVDTILDCRSLPLRCHVGQ